MVHQEREISSLSLTSQADDRRSDNDSPSMCLIPLSESVSLADVVRAGFFKHLILGGFNACSMLSVSNCLMYRLLHSMSGFFCPPTIHKPRARKESRSLARIME